ncbi:MAG: hypothetical protein LBI31_03615, partial [Zoogloeaceae bacterium]|jgi:hypothetical protein|nr:hypothetical protein [Zoogloeaceae bacterium]
MKTQTLSFLAMAVLAVVGCSKEGDTPSSSAVSVLGGGGMSDEQKLETYTKSDWLHDIDGALALEGRLLEKYGQTNFELIDKLEEGPSWAHRVAALSDADSSVRKCWPRGPSDKMVTTANTDHDCLDKLGYKRSR